MSPLINRQSYIIKNADVLNGHIFVRQLPGNRRALAAAEVEARTIVNVVGGSVNVAVGDGAVNVAVGAGVETAPADRVSLYTRLIDIALGMCIVADTHFIDVLN